MKLVIIEPLGVEEEKLMEIAHKALPDSVEIEYYQTKVPATDSLIEQGSIILLWMHAKNRELQYATVQAIQMLRFQILSLDF